MIRNRLKKFWKLILDRGELSMYSIRWLNHFIVKHLSISFLCSAVLLLQCVVNKEKLTQAITGTAEVNGTQIYYEIRGKGHPLVLVHGGLMDRRMWDDQFEFFARDYKVIRYDVRGHGRSAVPSEPFSHTHDLYGLLNYLNIESTYLIGLSMGGAIAIDFVLEHPDRLKLSSR